MSEENYIPDHLKKEEYQDTINELHPNGMLKKEIIYVSDKLIKEVFYNENGLIMKIIDRDSLGNILNEINMSQETSQHGLSFTYYPNGNVQSLKYFINGKVNWVEKIFNEDGQLAEVISYKKGIKSGPHTVYSSRNAKLSEVTYEKNTPTGKAKYFYETGELKAEMNFNEGRKNGVLKYFHKNGNLKKKESVINGIKQGYTSFYYENGAIKERWNYSNGKLNDECLKYDMHGQIIKKLYYNEGEVISGDQPVAKDDLDRLLFAEKAKQAEIFNQKKLTPTAQPEESKKIVKKEILAVKTPKSKEKRKSTFRIAISYSAIFVGILVIIYLIYNAILYFS
ncbi:MAG: toxin-antitoxin system YwqK family antitoxin [Bacteroidetes bacterium]|nr:toxin-antitoxin system YwqK family antitoxin [Bacteroidota bacterium]